MYGDRPISSKPLKVLAVRGPLTRKYLIEQNISCPEIYGDPALLLKFLYKPKYNKKYKLGIIPHYIDSNNEHLIEYIHREKELVKFIDIQHYNNWNEFIDQICSCEYIVSSSLHGIIVADTYNIPNVWIEFSNLVAGNGFKFHDYFASVKRDVLNPFVIKEKIETSKLLSFKNEWKPINIDLEGLISNCPFTNLKKIIQNFKSNN